MTALKPVLAELMPEGRLDHYLTNDLWVADQKLDGQRILIQVIDGRVVALQRNGIVTSKFVPEAVYKPFRGLKTGEWYFDGELLDGVLWLFDMPLAGTHVSPSDPLDYRIQMLDGFYDGYLAGNPGVRLLPHAYSAADKAALHARTLAEGGEGVMFKHLDKPYDQPNNPNAKQGIRSRWILKAKNRQTVDCVVTRIRLNGKDNMELAVYDGATLKVIGECTALAGDGPRVQPGDVVEVLYLYANDRSAPRLYQPTKPMIRTDKTAPECTIDQLVYANKSVLL